MATFVQLPSPHTDIVASVCVSADGGTIVSASYDGTIAVYDTDNKKLLRSFRGHSNIILCVDISPDAQLCVSSSMDNTIKIWNVQEASCISTLVGHLQPVYSCSFSQDGLRIVSSSFDKTLRVWNIWPADETCDIFEDNLLEAETANCNNNYTNDTFLASPNNNDTKDDIHSSNTCLDSTSMERKLTNAKVHSLKTGNRDVFELLSNSDRPVTGRRYLADTRRPSTGYSQRSEAAPLTEKICPECIHILAGDNGHKGSINRCSFSKDGQLVISASSDKTAKIWSLETGLCLTTLRPHENVVYDASLDPINRSLAATACGNDIILWDLHGIVGVCDAVDINSNAFLGNNNPQVEAGLMRKLKGHIAPVLRSTFSSDGHVIISAASDGIAMLWSSASGCCLRRFQHKHGTNPLYDAIFCPQTPYSWRVQARKTSIALEAGRAPPEKPNTLIITAAADSSINLWSIPGPIATKESRDAVPETASVPYGNTRYQGRSSVDTRLKTGYRKWHHPGGY